MERKKRECHVMTCGIEPKPGRIFCPKHGIPEKVKDVIKTPPRNIQVVFVEAVLMPNGELLSLGKSLGQKKNHKIYEREACCEHLATCQVEII